MTDFLNTLAGRKLTDGTLPNIAKQLSRIADALKAANSVTEVPKNNTPDLSCEEGLVCDTSFALHGMWYRAFEDHVVGYPVSEDGVVSLDSGKIVSPVEFNSPVGKVLRALKLDTPINVKPNA